MKRLIIGMLAMGALVVTLGATQDGGVTEAIAQIRKDLADLGLRLAQLEHASGMPAAEPSGEGASNAPAHAMVVGGIDTATGVVDNQDQIDELKGDIDSLQKTVDYHADLAADAVNAGDYVYRDRGRWVGDRRAARRETISQEEMVERYGAQLSGKKRTLERLQNQQNLPRQIIHGHDGETIITLKTKYDLSQSLTEIKVGDVVTWTGTRLSMDEGSETWRIDTISKVE